TKYAKNISQVGADFRFYQTLIPNERLTFGGRFGADHNFNGFAVGQAQFLGYEDALRGFRIQRFAGRSRAFANADLRWKISDVNMYLFPASIGMVFFNDVGRVWMDNEESHTWHDGYGFGLWVCPARKFLVTGSLTFSKEESGLAILTFGYQF
ncbi:MAG TPA: hypothetical protein VNS32_10745, partial [Flavisolibacter sp.]|nr:hypothetical protein [Flavisolibacter sp.]